MITPGVDAFVVFEEKILLLLRDNIPNIAHPNMWCLPGGGIEDGESEKDALFRELKEEINLTPTRIQYIDKTSYQDGNIVSKFLIILSREEKEHLKLDEGQRMDFFDLVELEFQSIIPNLQHYLRLNKEKIQMLIMQSSA